MENLRWILIFAGVAILLLLYFSGRPQKAPKKSARQNAQADGGSLHDEHDPLLGDDDFHMIDDVDPDDFVRPGGGESGRTSASRSDAPATDLPSVEGGKGFGSLSQKIDAFSERLASRRRQRVADAEPAEPESTEDTGSYATKIVTLHIMAPQGQLIDGAQLLEVFERHNLEFGEMNIFHSRHKGKAVFSVAKVVEPGFFDIENIDSFTTPGVVMILQLPGPVPADVAFEVLVSEAAEIAGELGARVLDSDRSTLSKQTIQHMRDGIYEYMHRQKYFSGVPS